MKYELDTLQMTLNGKKITEEDMMVLMTKFQLRNGTEEQKIRIEKVTDLWINLSENSTTEETNCEDKL